MCKLLVLISDGNIVDKYRYMWLLPQKTSRNAQNQFFSFVRKYLLLHMVMKKKKITDWGFLAFWLFENEWKFWRKRKNDAKNLKFGKKWVSTTTGTPPTKPWNVRTYHHHHTSYYVDHQFPIINTNRFVIHCCKFYFFLNWTVLFICFTVNLLPMQNYLCF